MAEKLLLADDSVTIQKVVELTLADEEYDITMVSDGASALTKAEEVHPDLILADIVMPELNGYELCEKIKKHPSLSHTPVMLLSSTFETYDEERGKSVGASDHIIKPFESEELIQKIRNNIEKKGEAPAATFEAAPPAELESAAIPAPSMAAMDASSEIVEEETFDFELTDEFMEEAEEMFVEESDEFASSSLAVEEETEELLTDDLPELEEMDRTVTPSSFEEPQPAADLVPETPQEISMDDFEELTQEEETAPAVDLGGETLSEEAPTIHEEPVSAWNEEIDKDLVEEEEVNVYEIPEEYAEGSELPPLEPVVPETPFMVEDASEEPAGDLIDEFMATEEVFIEPDAVSAEDQEVTDAEIAGAVEPEPALPSLETEAVDSFEDVFPTQGAATSEWSPELASYGGSPETVTDDVVEKPLPQEVLTEQALSVSEDAVRKIVSEVVEKMASEIIEKVSWEVIPDLAETMIQKEIQRLQQEVKPS